jgi:PAS domain S-box-containing protein
VVTFFAIAVSFGIYVSIAASSLRSNLLNSMIVNARVIGEYSVSPIVFEDKNGGSDVLQKVAEIAEIKQAYIFDAQGKVFADYFKIEEDLITPEYRKEASSEFIDDYLLVYQPIVYLNTNYGTIYLKISTQYISDKLYSQIRLMLLLGLGVLLLSWVFANSLQKIISIPILDLTAHADSISKNKDFSLRIKKTSSDEIGRLYDRFNHMVEQVEKHEKYQIKNQLALSKSEGKYRNIFQNSMMGIYRQSIVTREVLDMNDSAANILGIDKSDIDKRTNKLFTSVKDRDKFLKILNNDGVVNNFEAQITRKDGGILWASVSGRIIDEGIYEGVIQDVTVNKENYMNLQKANFELDNFVYHTSHDLRSPLLSVLGLVNIATKERDHTQLQLLLVMIEKSIRKLDGLVNDLLVLSRDNRVDDPFSIIDIEALTNESISNYDFISGFDQIKINVSVNAETSLFVDKTRVNVLLNNLISNSIKYRQKLGESSYININIHVTKVFCEIVIADNGEGIREEFQEQIFDMFYRATESSDGSGLGLYIVKNVMDKLEGEINFESTYGHGTTFVVKFPNHYSEDQAAIDS